jgi:hypothetical protein
VVREQPERDVRDHRFERATLGDVDPDGEVSTTARRATRSTTTATETPELPSTDSTVGLGGAVLPTGSMFDLP